MLERQVQIRDDLFAGGESLDQLIGEVDRVSVQDTDPFELIKLIQLAEQLGQSDSAVKIHAIVGGVLGDDN